jgi:hypothetical protein
MRMVSAPSIPAHERSPRHPLVRRQFRGKIGLDIKSADSYAAWTRALTMPALPRST